MTKKRKEKLESICGTAEERTQFNITIDGYAPALYFDGYQHGHQLNIKLTSNDMKDIMDINQEFFDNEITNSTLGRILLRKGIKSFKDIK